MCALIANSSSLTGSAHITVRYMWYASIVTEELCCTWLYRGVRARVRNYWNLRCAALYTAIQGSNQKYICHISQTQSNGQMHVITALLHGFAGKQRTLLCVFGVSRWARRTEQRKRATELSVEYVMDYYERLHDGK